MAKARALVGTPPVQGTWRHIHPAVLAVDVLLTVIVGVALPVLGVSLVAFLVVDAAMGLARRVRARRAEPPVLVR